MLTSITHTNAAGTITPPLNSFTYTYDNAEKITKEVDYSGAGTTTKNYAYDATNQVTGDGTGTYTWDANGKPGAWANWRCNDSTWLATDPRLECDIAGLHA